VIDELLVITRCSSLQFLKNPIAGSFEPSSVRLKLKHQSIGKIRLGKTTTHNITYQHSERSYSSIEGIEIVFDASPGSV
jgi:hypothetical protein